MSDRSIAPRPDRALTYHSSGRAKQRRTGELGSLLRQEKLGVSYRVEAPVGNGLATHPYWVLRP
jgi:hypothetical protein